MHDPAVDLVQAERVDLEHVQRRAGNVMVHPSVGAHLGVVPDTAQEAVRNARRSARPLRNLGRRLFVDLHPEKLRRPEHNARQVDRVVGVDSQGDSEARTQRPADQALAGRSADGREASHGNRMHARAGTASHNQIHAEVLQGRVQHLLHIGQQAVDLVDKEHLPLLHAGQHSCQVQLLLQYGS